MNSQPDRPRPDEGTNAQPPTALRGRWLTIARTAWAAVAGFAVGTCAVGAWITFATYPIMCEQFGMARPVQPPGNADTCINVNSLVDVRVLKDLGFLELYAAYYIALSVVLVLGFWVVGAVIFWKKSNDWMALLASLMLITLGSSHNIFPQTLMDNYPAWGFPLSLVWEHLAFLLLFLLFYLFPDGRFVPGWTRWVAIFLSPFFVTEWILRNSPYVPFHWVPLDILVFLSLLASLAFAQIYRYVRVSGPVERQQTKWVVYSLIAQIAVYAVWFTGADAIFWRALVSPGITAQLIDELGSISVWTFSLLLIPLCLGISVLRYRLWDIDIIINRTLLYGTLTASVIGLYVLVVGGLGTLLQAPGNPAVSLLATGLIAVLFVPLRDWLQHGVNRLIYGERDDPYKVLSRLGRRLEATIAPEAALKTIVETIAQALKVPYVAIDLRREGDEFATAVEYGTLKGEPVVLPLVYQREAVGRLIVAPRAPGENFSPADMHLLEDLARQIEPAVHAVRLTADLQRSREQLVKAREEERRRLRRDLHDGLGPTLGGLTLGLDAARGVLAQDPKGADALLAALKAKTQEAVSDIRRLVYDLRPPALDDLGLVAAIYQQAANHGLLANEARGGTKGKDGLIFSVEAPEKLPPLPAAVEVACYRIAQEAITNAAHHAKAKTCHVRLSVDEAVGALELEVVDDGIGIPEDRRAGVGMSSMRERAAELGGTCLVGPVSTGGTRVLARLPLPGKEE